MEILRYIFLGCWTKGGKMENFEDLIKLQQRYEYLKKHPKTKVYPFLKEDIGVIDTKFFFCKKRRKWRRIKRIFYAVVAILLFLYITLFKVSYYSILEELNQKEMRIEQNEKSQDSS